MTYSFDAILYRPLLLGPCLLSVVQSVEAVCISEVENVLHEESQLGAHGLFIVWRPSVSRRVCYGSMNEYRIMLDSRFVHNMGDCLGTVGAVRFLLLLLLLLLLSVQATYAGMKRALKVTDQLSWRDILLSFSVIRAHV